VYGTYSIAFVCLQCCPGSYSCAKVLACPLCPRGTYQPRYLQGRLAWPSASSAAAGPTCWPVIRLRWDSDWLDVPNLFETSFWRKKWPTANYLINLVPAIMMKRGDESAKCRPWNRLGRLLHPLYVIFYMIHQYRISYMTSLTLWFSRIYSIIVYVTS
jgi:hypothetical protein